MPSNSHPLTHGRQSGQCSALRVTEEGRPRSSRCISGSILLSILEFEIIDLASQCISHVVYLNPINDLTHLYPPFLGKPPGIVHSDRNSRRPCRCRVVHRTMASVGDHPDFPSGTGR